MLAQTLFLLTAIAIFALSAIAGIAGTARGRLANAAKALIVPATETALAAYQHELTATIAAQIPQPGSSATAPPSAIDALNARTPFAARNYTETPDPASPLVIAVQVVPTATTQPACNPGAAVDTGPDIEANAQCSPFAQESRLALEILTDVGPADPSGTVTPLAHGRFTVTLRLFAQPPYAMVSGAKDASDPSQPHEADAGGWGNALGTFSLPGPSPDDTTIHILYACTPALGDCSASLPRPADDPTSLPWTNGNGSAG